jgi:hypothetical protein
MKSEFHFFGKNREQFTAGGTLPQCQHCSLPTEQHPNPSCDKTEALLLRESIFDAATITYSLTEYIQGLEHRRDWRKPETETDKNLRFVADMLHRLQLRLIGLPQPTTVVEPKEKP